MGPLHFRSSPFLLHLITCDESTTRNRALHMDMEITPRRLAAAELSRKKLEAARALHERLAEFAACVLSQCIVLLALKVMSLLSWAYKPYQIKSGPNRLNTRSPSFSSSPLIPATTALSLFHNCNSMTYTFFLL